MTPSSHYAMLKGAAYAPTLMPTMDTMKDNRSWLARNKGLVAGGVGSLGLALAPFTAGLSLVPTLAIEAGLAGGGMLYDYFDKRNELKRQQDQWYRDEQARENAAVRSGEYFGAPNNMQGAVSQLRDSLSQFPGYTQQPKPATQAQPAAPAQPAAQPQVVAPQLVAPAQNLPLQPAIAK